MNLSSEEEQQNYLQEQEQPAYMMEGSASDDEGDSFEDEITDMYKT